MPRRRIEIGAVVALARRAAVRPTTGQDSDWRWTTASPAIASASRLVVRIRSRGAVASRRSAIPATASTRCSALSSRRSSSLSARNAWTVARAG